MEYFAGERLMGMAWLNRAYLQAHNTYPAKLARDAGVGEATIYKILNSGGRAKVVESAHDRIRRALGLDPYAHP